MNLLNNLEIKKRIKDIFEGKEKINKEVNFLGSSFNEDEKLDLSTFLNVFSELNYQIEDKLYLTPKDSVFENKEVNNLIDKLVKIAILKNKSREGAVWYIKTKRKPTSYFIRKIAKDLKTSSFGSNNNLLIFNWDEKDQFLFVFPFFTLNQIELRKLQIDKNNLYQTDLEVLSNIFVADEKVFIQKLWLEAFNVEKVSEKFFDDYFRYFNKLWTEINNQLKEYDDSLKISKYIAHQLLNRLMFCFFLEKKSNWLGEDKKFIRNFVKEYEKLLSENKIEKNTFYNNWLKSLFLEAFNKRFIRKNYFSDKINSVLFNAPFLNGGLFEENEYDKYDITISDELIINQIIEDFLLKYNFTIVESAPLEKEVAVNPELIGKVYEKFVNIETTPQIKKKYDSEGNSKGIVYTQEKEIDFMCKKSLIEYLLIKIPELPREYIYDFIYVDIDDFNRLEISRELFLKLKNVLENIKIVDPAVGSGSFLVGFLNLLVNLHKKIQKFEPAANLTDFGLKKKIIKNNLYGVDVMDWAVKIAELRLWLSLIIESDLKREQLQLEPLLPNLDFKIRQGDSLIQYVEDYDISDLFINMKNFELSTKNRLNNLIEKKLDFYENPEKYKYFEIENEKFSIFSDILDIKIIELQQQKENFKKNINNKHKQNEMFNDFDQTEINYFDENENKSKKEKNEMIDRKIKKLKDLKNQIITKKELSFLWQLDFPEVFYRKENSGFDIVIGNPPYVRQEEIEPPLLQKNKFSDDEWKNQKIIYKQRLQSLVEKIYSKEFVPKSRADLYVYFYFKSLSLLNKDGIFCFITSNSWLDVDFGAKLQEFLLRRTKIIGIYDNQAVRSFKQADINTIIIFTTAPSKDEKSNLSHFAKFVVFKKPFDEVLKKEILLKIDKNDPNWLYDKPIFELVKNRKEEDEFNIFPIRQSDLLKDGLMKIEESESINAQEQIEGTYVYQSNKWGGKFLRAPKIFWKILEKGKNKLIKLRDIAEIRFGIKTGANEFFYLKPVGKTVKEVVEIAEKNPDTLIRVKNGADWEGEIEARFLKPVIKSPRELKTIIVRLEDLNYLVFMCHEPKSKLVGTKALEYINWGEKQKFHERPTCKSREKWWDLGIWEISKNILPMFENERKYCFYNISKAYIDAALYWVYSKANISEEILNVLLNSIIIHFYKEVSCRPPEGLGALQMKVYHYNEMLIPPIKNLKLEENFLKTNFLKLILREIPTIFTEIGFDPKKVIREQEPNPLPYRKALDDIVFDALGLNEEERKEVYWAVAELVKNRIEKARSF